MLPGRIHSPSVLAAPLVPAAGQPLAGLRAVPHGERSLWVHWERPPAPVTGYVLEWQRVSSEPARCSACWQRERGGGTTGALIHDGIEPFQRYNISVYPLYKDAVGVPVHVAAYSKQKAPSHAPKLHLKSISKSEAELCWDSIPVEMQNGFITSYTIFWANSTVDVSSAVVPSSSISFFVFFRPAPSAFIQRARCYARPVRKRKKDLPSHLDDLPPTMLKKDYMNVPIINSVDDVVKRLLSLEMASQKEKVKIKTQQLVEKVRRSPNDDGSFEVQVARLTAKIRTYEEHLQKRPKDKSNRRRMLMDMDRRRKLLAYLRRVRYDVFENTCKQLNIQYTFPPAYSRRITKRWLAKKALCLKVFQEVQKLKAPERLKQRQEWRARAKARAKAEKERQAQQSEGTAV
ncbi:PREDICTED: 28S ribosomal protein S15, mitochondrial [Tinamus guttatus]|uniref:28S ribosomal protein S15, mitochondrial n=1 Tax=Tinamus guttatus TaxID=94827 RepID=UPI00052E7729|nr:PREDICTED: 28S ribosomal protein S15, mitochondrial [Tinamus guttatus]